MKGERWREGGETNRGKGRGGGREGGREGRGREREGGREGRGGGREGGSCVSGLKGKERTDVWIGILAKLVFCCGRAATSSASTSVSPSPHCRYVGREPVAAPATGCKKTHTQEQEDLVLKAIPLAL